LIETSFEDWYVEREVQRQRFAGPLAIAEAKRADQQKLIAQQKEMASKPPARGTT
jgi:hypothetical protein